MANNHAGGAIQNLIAVLGIIFSPENISEKYTNNDESIKSDMDIIFREKDLGEVTLTLSDNKLVYFSGKDSDNKITNEEKTNELMTKMTGLLEKWKPLDTAEEA